MAKKEKVQEMFDAEKKWLPQFEGKALRKAENIEIPEGTVPREVPLDPALAINNRFSRLAE